MYSEVCSFLTGVNFKWQNLLENPVLNGSRNIADKRSKGHFCSENWEMV